jgi:U3 small nucleolar RNA-associated protein 21
VWNRARPLRTLTWATANASAPGKHAKQTGEILSLLCQADILISLHFEETRGAVRVWDVHLAESTTEDALITTVFLPPAQNPTVFIHPDTYLNKVAIGTENGSVLIVNIRNGKLVHECKVNPGVAVTALAQSDTVDIIGVGFADGTVSVINLRADKCICTFSHASADATARGAITALAFSADNTLLHPTLVSATEHGAIALWNLADKCLQHLHPGAHDSTITLLGFLPRQPAVITAGADNTLNIWSIDKLDGSLKALRARTGHQAPPRIIRYYGGASVASLSSGTNAAACEIVSAGSDLTLRSFHTGLDRQNAEVSQGSLRARARELGVHPSSLRLPPITSLAASDRQHGHWADVVTTHAGESKAYIWSWDNKRLEDRVLQLYNKDEIATTVCISSCGNFSVVGGSLGSVCSFNLQSAARRSTFPKDARVDTRLVLRGKRRPAAHEYSIGDPVRDTGKGRGAGNALGMHDSVDTSLLKVLGIKPPALRAADEGLPVGQHTAPICGVAVDSLNQTLVSADVSGVVNFWDFTTTALKATVTLASPASFLVVHKDANLIAFACDDFVVRVVDFATLRVVRTFSGHRNRITDMTFSPDGRWLVTASLDRALRVWDLPSTRCIDWLVFQHAVTSVTFSPTDEFLVTTHVDGLGLSLWANKNHFSSVLLDVGASVPVMMDLPNADADLDAPTNADDVQPHPKRARTMDSKLPAVSPDPDAADISPKLNCHITLSGAPLSQWHNLSKLDVIASRNKPKEPPKKPESAPFFLPTTGGLNPAFISTSNAEAAAEPGESKDDGDQWLAVWKDDEGDNNPVEPSQATVAMGRIRQTIGTRKAQTVLAHLLRAAQAAAFSDGVLRDIAQHLTALPPTAVDIELRSLCLSSADAAGLELLSALLGFFAHQVATGELYELTQAQLQLFLQIYQDVIVPNPELSAAVRAVRDAERDDAARLRRMLDKSLCMVSLFLGQ